MGKVWLLKDMGFVRSSSMISTMAALLFLFFALGSVLDMSIITYDEKHRVKASEERQGVLALFCSLVIVF